MSALLLIPVAIGTVMICDACNGSMKGFFGLIIVALFVSIYVSV